MTNLYSPRGARTAVLDLDSDFELLFVPSDLPDFEPEECRQEILDPNTLATTSPMVSPAINATE